MSFSEECFVKMNDGSKKSIRDVNVNDKVLDIFNNYKVVSNKIILTSCTSFNIFLGNSSGSFFVNKDVLMKSECTDENSKNISLKSVEEIYKNGWLVKENIKKMGGVKINYLIEDKNRRNLYDIILENDKSNCYFVNDIITTGEKLKSLQS